MPYAPPGKPGGVPRRQTRPRRRPVSVAPQVRAAPRHREALRRPAVHHPVARPRPRPSPRQIRANRIARRVQQRAQRGYQRGAVRQIARRQRKQLFSGPTAWGGHHERLPVTPSPAPRPSTLIDYLNPRAQRRSVAGARRAAARSTAIYDSRSRTLYLAPSDVQVGREYRALGSRSSQRQGQAIQRLNRWGYEGPNAGHLLARRLGRFAVPESSLHAKRKVIAYKPGGKPVYAGPERTRYSFKGQQYARIGGRYVPFRSGGVIHPLDVFTKGARFLSRQRVPSQAGSSSRVGGVPIASTVPPSGSAKIVRGGATFGGRFAADIVSLPANVITSGYYTARELKRGHAGRLLRQFAKTDPVALVAQGKFKQAAKAAGQHPGLTALELYGAGSAASRFAGRASDFAGLTTRRRLVRTLPRTHLGDVRQEPLGLVARGYARRQRQRARATRDEHIAKANAATDHDVWKHHMEQAARANPDRFPEGAIKHAVDVREGLAQSRRRPGRGQAVKAAREALRLPKGAKGEQAIRLLAEGIVNADKGDLHRYVRQLAQEAPSLRPAARIANWRVRNQLTRIANDEKVDMGALQDAARRYARVVRPLEEEATTEGMLGVREAHRARLKPYAVSQMGDRVIKVGDEGGLIRSHQVPEAEALRKQYHQAIAKGASREEKDALKAQIRPLVRGEHEIEAHMGERSVGAETRAIAQPHQLQEAARSMERRADRIGEAGDQVGAQRMRRYAAEASAKADEAAAKGGPVEIVLPGERSAVPSPEDISFVSQGPTFGSGAFNVGSRQARGFSGRTRTGAAVLHGRIDLNPMRLIEQVARTRGLVDATREWRGMTEEVGFRNPDGSLFHGSNKDAQAAIEDLQAEPGAHEWTVFRLNPWYGRAEQLQATLARADREGYVIEGQGKGLTAEHHISSAVEDAVRGTDIKGYDGEWGVMPKVAADRLIEHAQVYRSVAPAWRAISRAFRTTVLPFSLPWVTGNGVEAALRTAILGAGFRSWLTYRRVFNDLAIQDPSISRALFHRLPEPEAGSVAEQLLHITPGGHFGGTEMANTYLSTEMFAGSSRPVRLAAEALGRLARTPGPRELSRFVGRYTDLVFHGINSGMEAQFTRAMAGHYMRRFLMSHKDRRNMEAAVEQAARGILDTAEQRAMRDYVVRAYGQYDSFSPGMRKWIIGYTPFLAWTMNAAKFLGSVMPKDHPGLTALAAIQNRLAEDWRKEHGLDVFDPKGKSLTVLDGAVPDFLQGSIPLPGGSHLRLARYTPFGLWMNPVDTVASNFVPFLSGPLMSARGVDWKGDPIRGKNGQKPPWPLLGLIGMRELMYSTVPIVGLVARARQKEGSPLSRAIQVENPLNPVKPRKDALGGTTGNRHLDRALDKIGQHQQRNDTLNRALDKINKKR